MSLGILAHGPRNWKSLKLGELVTIRYGKMLPTKELSESGFPVFGANGVIGFHTKYLYEDEQVLISCRGAYSGKINLSPPHCYVTNNSLVLEFSSEPQITKRFLFYGLQAVDRSKMVTGSAQPQVTINNAEVLELGVPPIELQQGIVAEIEKQFTRLEAGVAALRRVQANLKRYRAAVLKAACEGRLVRTEAELARKEHRGYEGGEALLVRILAERRQKQQGRGLYKEPMAVDAASLPPLPKGWTWATAEQLTSLITSGSRAWGEYYSDTGPLFIRAQDIKTDALNLMGVARVALPENAEGTRSSVENSDLLVTITGANVTKSAFVRFLCETAFVSQHVALLKPVCREASPFQFLWIVSPANGRRLLEQWAYGAGKPGLSLEQVRALPIGLPPLAEQTRIVAEVERRLSVVEELEASVAANLQRAARLRQSILQKAFTGGLA